MTTTGKRWTAVLLLVVCVIVVLSGAVSASPLARMAADDPPAVIPYETVRIPPTADTYIHTWFSGSNFDQAWTLTLRASDVSAPLFQFDLATVPQSPYVTIAKGTLYVYVKSRTNATDLTVAACQVLRPWVSNETTWLRATIDTLWQVPGGNGALDRAHVCTTPAVLREAGMWVPIDVTEMVRGWYLGDAENNGLILKSQSSGSVSYEIISKESNQVALRPYLEVTYGLVPTPQPTIPPLPALNVTKTGPTGPLQISGYNTIDYTIVVANNHELDFNNIVITDVLPLGTEFLGGSAGAVFLPELQRVRWQVPAMSVGQSVTMSLSLGVPSWVKADGNVVNVVRVACDECQALAESYWEIPVNIVATPTPVVQPTPTAGPTPRGYLLLPEVHHGSFWNAAGN